MRRYRDNEDRPLAGGRGPCPLALWALLVSLAHYLRLITGPERARLFAFLYCARIKIVCERLLAARRLSRGRGFAFCARARDLSVGF